MPVFGSWQVCSILKDDPALHAQRRNDNTKGRPPLAILRRALTGDLLEMPFAPLGLPHGTRPPPPNRRRRVGIAWSSISNNRPIPEKSIPLERFLPILAAIDADFISLQRMPDVADPKGLLHKSRVRFLPEEVVGAEDEYSLYTLVEEIRDLDCIVTISTTTTHMAAAMGIRVEVIAGEREGQQWFWQVQACHQKCFYPRVKVHLGDGRKENWWEKSLASVRASLSRLESVGK